MNKKRLLKAAMIFPIGMLCLVGGGVAFILFWQFLYAWLGEWGVVGVIFLALWAAMTAAYYEET